MNETEQRIADEIKRGEWSPVCPYCGRVMSWREHNEQGACNECNGGAYADT